MAVFILRKPAKVVSLLAVFVCERLHKNKEAILLFKICAKMS